MMSMKLITSKKLTELSKEALRLEIDLVLDELLSAEGSQLFTLRAKTISNALWHKWTGRHDSAPAWITRRVALYLQLLKKEGVVTHSYRTSHCYKFIFNKREWKRYRTLKARRYLPFFARRELYKIWKLTIDAIDNEQERLSLLKETSMRLRALWSGVYEGHN